MTPTLVSEAEISELLKATKPIEVEVNRAVNSLLTIKRWGFRSLVDAVAKATVEDPILLKQAIRLSITLSEFDFHLVERALLRAGIDVCAATLLKTEELVRNAASSVETLETRRDDLFTVDGVRRTPGGIFWRLLKSAVPKEDSKFIFKDNTKRQQSLRRQLVRDKWTENHLTILTNRPGKKPRTTDDPVRAVKDIAAELSMSEVSIIERVVVKKSADFARALLAEVKTLLNQTAEDPYVRSMVMVGDRRRTPGGIFAQLVKSKADISDGDKRFIFARATGGRAPSMSDLMSMSLALQDRAQPRQVVPRPASGKDEWEFQRKVGDTWEPGFVGQDTFEEPLAEFLQDENASEQVVVGQISLGLKMYTTDFVERVLNEVGIATLVAAYKETVAVERSGGLAVSASNPRKRTPQGVFIAVLRKAVGGDVVDKILGTEDGLPSVLAPQVALGDALSGSKLADAIIVELERMRVPESDFEIVRHIVSLKGEAFTRGLFEKVRKRFNKGKWLDTPGQLFGKMLKIGVSNDELNQIFEASRVKQLVRSQRRALARRATVILTPSEEKSVTEVTLGLALIGVTANEVSVIERIIAKLGDEVAIRMLKRTQAIEREGGQRTRDQQRRKTPSGVFLSLLSTEEKVSKEDLKFVFDKPAASTAEERKKEDTHFAPSLFTPVNPLRFIDNSGKDTEFVDRVKKQIRPALSELEYISVLDPRLETVIRGVVLLGPAAIHLIDQCVHVFGEKRTEGWLEISHAQVADSKVSLEQLPTIYNDLVKAAGGLPSLETTAGVRC